jgi:hypothetical protein
MGFAVVAVVRTPAGLVSFRLFLFRQPGDQVGVGRGDPVALKGLSHFRDELKQREPGIDVALALSALTGECGDIMTGKVEQPLIACRFFVRMNVLSLSILDELNLEGLSVVQISNDSLNVGSLG